MCLVILCLCCQLTLGLKYYYGDGSYYTGDVDERGRPSGKGQFHNISGELGKMILLTFQNRCTFRHSLDSFSLFRLWGLL